MRIEYLYRQTTGSLILSTGYWLGGYWFEICQEIITGVSYYA